MDFSCQSFCSVAPQVSVRYEICRNFGNRAGLIIVGIRDDLKRYPIADDFRVLPHENDPLENWNLGPFLNETGHESLAALTIYVASPG